MSKVVDTSMDDWIAMGTSLPGQFPPERRQRIIVGVHDALLQRDNGVVGDGDRLRADLGTALRDVAIGDAALGLEELAPIPLVEGGRLVGGGAHQEVGSREFLGLSWRAQCLAG